MESSVLYIEGVLYFARQPAGMHVRRLREGAAAGLLDQESETLTKLTWVEKRSGYRSVFTGHSLGSAFDHPIGLRWGEIYGPAITTLAVFFISRTRDSTGFLAIVIGGYNRDRGGMGYHWYQLGELDMSTTLTRLVEEVTH